MSVSYVECECLKVKFLGAVSFFFFLFNGYRVEDESFQYSMEYPSKKNPLSRVSL